MHEIDITATLQSLMPLVLLVITLFLVIGIIKALKGVA
jgi:hypothetical protein